MLSLHSFFAHAVVELQFNSNTNQQIVLYVEAKKEDGREGIFLFLVFGHQFHPIDTGPPGTLTIRNE